VLIGVLLSVFTFFTCAKLKGVTDARRELADLLKEGLHDMATLRRQNNTYVAGILSQATSKLDVAAYVR
jgi:hypothetical protein